MVVESDQPIRSKTEMDPTSVNFNATNRRPQLTVAQLWQIVRQCLVEAIATAMLTFMVVRVGDVPVSAASSFSVPLTLTICIWLAGPISGGHVNPSVTLGVVLVRIMSPVYLLIYWCSQFGGGFAGAAFALVFQTAKIDSNSSVVYTEPVSHFGLRFLAELIASSIFILVVLCSADSKRPGVWLSPGFTTSLVVGFTALLTGFGFGPKFPVGVNPAVALASNIILQSYENLLINVLVPFLGSVVAAACFAFIFCPDACAKRAKAICMDEHFDHSNEYAHM